MADYIRALKWNLISLVIVAIVFVGISLEKGVINLLSSQTLALIALSFGGWAGYKIVQFNGNFGDVIIAGIIVGIVGAILLLFGFGIILKVRTIISIVVFDIGFNIAGALIAGGFALTK